MVVAGESTTHTELLRQIAENLGVADKAKFTGFISDEQLAFLYSSSLAYVQPSIYEPFGLGPLEAQSCGTPAVVWGDAGVKETVLDGETGFHAQPYDVADFASKLHIILTDKVRWEKMHRQARIWASSFNWDAHIDLLEGVLDEERR
jgi:glycosyltransferase involved in cell wall biosynthesis